MFLSQFCFPKNIFFLGQLDILWIQPCFYYACKLKKHVFLIKTAGALAESIAECSEARMGNFIYKLKKQNNHIIQLLAFLPMVKLSRCGNRYGKNASSVINYRFYLLYQYWNIGKQILVKFEKYHNIGKTNIGIFLVFCKYWYFPYC